MRRSKLALSPIERKAEFAKAAILKGKTMSVVAEEDFDISWIHLRECFKGLRRPSEELANKVAEYVGMSPEEFWGVREVARAS
jgi:hypothetical protein